MILSTYRLGGDVVEVVIDGTNLMFKESSSQSITTIEGLKLNKSGVIKEFPELEHDKEWRKKAIERLKEHVKKIRSETERVKYVKGELQKFGWEPLYMQRAGFRPVKL